MARDKRDDVTPRERSLLLSNANIITLNPDLPRATVLAAELGRVAYIGSSVTEARERVGSGVREVDLGGATVVPGFNDAHCHVLKEGAYLSWVDLRADRAPTMSQLCALISERASKTGNGAWILGHGYDQNKLLEKRHPTLQELDGVAMGHPILLRHVSGHIYAANSEALSRAGISGTTDDPPGGRIVRDASGHPTGVLEETAFQLAWKAIPAQSVESLTSSLKQVSDLLAADGVTSVQDAGVGSFNPLDITAFDAAAESGLLRQRASLNLVWESVFDDASAPVNVQLRSNVSRDWLRIGGVKIWADGSLIGRTAAMSADYLNDPDNRGMLRLEASSLREMVATADRHGWQTLVHAIGDQAIEEAILAFEAANVSQARLRHRIEHGGVLRDDLLERIQRAGLIIVTQPRFISELGDGFLAALGEERCQLTYPLASLFAHQIPVAGSSDRPVVRGAPMLGIHDAVNRTTLAGHPFGPAERVSVEQALGMFTVGAAYAEHQEHQKGRLMEGFLADATVLYQDPTAVAPEAIGSIAVQATIVGGGVIWERPLIPS